MIVLDAGHSRWQLEATATAVTIGVYDGVHRGHVHVLERLRAAAPELPIVVLTFATHPAAIVAPEHAPQLLTTLEHRIELLDGLGVDVVALWDFDERTRLLVPHQFIDEVLVAALHATHVAVGEGFRFGYKAAGSVETLRSVGARRGFEVLEVPVFSDPEPVRSTAIRTALVTGDVETAADLLGRPFQVRGEVLRGDRRGSQIGFPTANLVVPPELARPRRGVYAARAGVGNTESAAVVNVGVRPTFEGDQEFVEVHLLGIEKDLYGAELWVDFITRLRDERKFPSIEELVEQISEDASRAGAILAR